MGALLLPGAPSIFLILFRDPEALSPSSTCPVTADLVRTHLLLAFDVEGKER